MATVEQWNDWYKSQPIKQNTLLMSQRVRKKFYLAWEKHCKDNNIDPLFDFLKK